MIAQKATYLMLAVTFACNGTDDGDPSRDATQPADAVVDAPQQKDSAVDADLLGDRIDDVLSRTGRASVGAALYNISCSNCHDAQGEAVPNQGVRVRDSVNRLGQRAVVRRIIVGAGDYRTEEIFMPPFASVSNQNLADLLLHLEVGFDSRETDAGVGSEPGY